MGVMYGLEIARALAEDPATRHLAVDVASWADEEGAYGSFTGSRSFFGEFDDTDLELTNDEGESMAQALERCGIADQPRAAFEPGRQIACLEAHIEQGPHLEDIDKLIGVVTSIVGVRALHITFIGQQNHAGSTPMDRRADAGAALFEFGVQVRDRLAAIAGSRTVWTIGNFGVTPGAESIIPGLAWCDLQFRDADDAILDQFEAEIRAVAAEMTAAGPVQVQAEIGRAAVPAAHMAAELRGHLRLAAQQHAPDSWVEMPSAAAHDAQIAARHVPTAMLFIPSIGGISHDFAEDSHHRDIVLGCQVLAEATVAILS
jgi:N-carbamoyl-L-amino-acid hydrolase